MNHKLYRIGMNFLARAMHFLMRINGIWAVSVSSMLKVVISSTKAFDLGTTSHNLATAIIGGFRKNVILFESHSDRMPTT